MTPARRAASRLGWLIVGGAIVFTVYILVVPTGWVGIAVGLALGCGLSFSEATLYRWVTAPERDAETPLLP